MLRKILCTSTILASSITPCFAGNFYLGPSLVLQNTTSSKSENGYFRGISPKLTVGYGTFVSPTYYLAGEVFGLFGTGTLSNKHDTTSLKTSRSFGASFVPGMMLNEATELYTRIGVISTKFTDPDKYTTGAQLGVGIQTQVTESWDIRGEYIYSAYQSVSGLSSPRSDAFVLGVIHRFG